MIAGRGAWQYARGERRATVSIKESGLCTLYMMYGNQFLTGENAWKDY